MTERLRARADRRGPAFDLLAAYGSPGGFFMEREGLGVAAGSAIARGVSVDGSARADLRRLAGATVAALRAFETEAGSGSAPVAMGVVPFEEMSPVTLRVPVHAVRRDEPGATWALELADPGGGDASTSTPERVGSSPPHHAFLPVQLQEAPSSAAYAESVAEAVGAIHAGDFAKVVLARTLVVDAGRQLDPRRLAHRLRAVEPHGYTFAVPSTTGGTLVGASPELLLERRGDVVRSNPLAGSAPRSGDPDEDRSNAQALEDSGKDREEHALVVAAVAEILGEICDDLAFDHEPVLLPTANVWHLSTRFRGTLRDPGLSALDVVAELHPTPAVCGTPTPAARAAIATAEPFERGSYAGPVGWVDADGDGVWAIALRCAELDGTRARLFAGAGIVAGSEPGREVDETDRKFRAFLDSLRWG
jgi:isochorismate synthase